MAANQGGELSVLDDPRINARADFFTGLGNGIDGSWASRIGLMVPSNQEIERYNWIGSAPHMSTWEGPAKFHRLPNYGGGLRNVEFLAGIEIQKADLRRDKTGQIRQRVSDLGGVAATHWEELDSTLILNGETDGGGTIETGLVDLTSQAFDGQAFFDTDHTYAGSAFTASQSNDLSAGTFDIATATAPTAVEAALVIQAMIGQFYSFKNDQGQPINGNAKNFLFMVGTVDLWAGVSAAISQMQLSSGETNRLNGLKSQGVSMEAILNPRLSSKTTQVYCFRTDSPVGAFVHQEEVPVDVSEEDPGEFEKYIRVGAKATRNAGYARWTDAIVATLS